MKLQVMPWSQTYESAWLFCWQTHTHTHTQLQVYLSVYVCLNCTILVANLSFTTTTYKTELEESNTEQKFTQCLDTCWAVGPGVDTSGEKGGSTQPVRGGKCIGGSVWKRGWLAETGSELMLQASHHHSCLTERWGFFSENLHSHSKDDFARENYSFAKTDSSGFLTETGTLS